MKKVLLGASTALLLAGCASPTPAVTVTVTPTPMPEKFTAHVKLELQDMNYVQKLYNVNTKTDSGCKGKGPYQDLAYNGNATLEDLDELPLSLDGDVVKSELTARGAS